MNSTKGLMSDTDQGMQSDSYDGTIMPSIIITDMILFSVTGIGILQYMRLSHTVLCGEKKQRDCSNSMRLACTLSLKSFFVTITFTIEKGELKAIEIKGMLRKKGCFSQSPERVRLSLHVVYCKVLYVAKTCTKLKATKHFIILDTK